MQRFVMSKNACGRGRGAWARAVWRHWYRWNGTIMSRKPIWEKTLQKTLKFSDCRESIRTQIRSSFRKIFRVHFVFVGFRESSAIRRFERIFGLRSKCLCKELPPLSNFIHKAKKFLQSAEKPRYELAIQCYAVLVRSSFRVITTGDKGELFNYSFFSFLCLLSSYSARVCAPCAPIKRETVREGVRNRNALSSGYQIRGEPI